MTGRDRDIPLVDLWIIAKEVGERLTLLALENNIIIVCQPTVHSALVVLLVVVRSQYLYCTTMIVSDAKQE